MSDNAKDQAAEKNASKLVESAEEIIHGVITLQKPIQDGEKTYDKLIYDFNKLSGWELAKAIDSGTTGKPDGMNLTNMQALALFAAAAAKCTEGLDETDIYQRMGPFDTVIAIKIATVFFRASSLAGSMRITKQ